MPTSITLVATSTSVSPSANPRMASCLSALDIWPWIRPTAWSGNSVRRRRSASSVAAAAWSASDSDTSGQTTKHWRPFGDLLAHPLVRPGPGACAVDDVRLHGTRPAGRWRSTVVSRSP